MESGIGDGTRRPASDVVSSLRERVRQRVTVWREDKKRVEWPCVDPQTLAGVAVVVVNRNTLDLTSHLVFSVHRVLPPGAVRKLVVVDNKSSDGSVDLLKGLDEAGVITLLQNRGAPYHGPGLSLGISHLAQLQREIRVRYVWVLDSDVVVLRPDTLTAASEALGDSSAALVGQVQPHEMMPGGYAHVASLLMDPEIVWRSPIPPFREHGDPGVPMQRAMHRGGMHVANFPFFRDEYLLHLGAGTLRVVALRGERRNRYYDWAVANQDPHFHSNPQGPERFAAFLEWFRDEVGKLTAHHLAAACLVGRDSEQGPGATPSKCRDHERGL